MGEIHFLMKAVIWMPSKDNSVASFAQQILTQVKTVVVGKDPMLLWVLAAILARGHILLEDIPGVGKTTMALAFSRVLSLSCSRVQFTPDVLPSDVTGYCVPDAAGGMRYQPGAVLCNLFLADELNRAPPAPSPPFWRPWRKGRSRWTG